MSTLSLSLQFKIYLSSEKNIKQKNSKLNNKQYYDFLPFAIVLKVTNKWIKKLKILYAYKTDYYYLEAKLYNRTYKNINRVMSSKDYSSISSNGRGGGGTSSFGGSGGRSISRW